MPSAFSHEVEAIQELRKEFPAMGQRTLTQKIKDRNFNDSRLLTTAKEVSDRPYFSIYGVIRRFDKKNKPALVGSFA